jgi:pentatricopeptide repeat protein
MLGEYDAALQEIQGTAETETEVLMLHALAALRRTSEAMHLYNRLSEASLPPYVIGLREEIASRFALRPNPPEHDQQWLVGKECEAMLLAA